MGVRRTLLVVGAKDGSLGRAIADEAEDDSSQWNVWTAGIAGEDHFLDVTMESSIRDLFAATCVPECIVVTAGVNIEGSIMGDVHSDMLKQYVTNTFGPINVLSEWLKAMSITGQKSDLHAPGYQFVAISSNSAHVARSQSMGYCASKAALSMALRCSAREMARSGVSIYGYEPGWIDGTPMSNQVIQRMGLDSIKHRIPSGKGVDVGQLASLVVNNLSNNETNMLNGCMIRVDGGEQ